MIPSAHSTFPLNDSFPLNDPCCFFKKKPVTELWFILKMLTCKASLAFSKYKNKILKQTSLLCKRGFFVHLGNANLSVKQRIRL